MSGAEELISKLYKTIDKKKWEELEYFFHEDIVYERPGYPKMTGCGMLKSYYANIRIISYGVHEIVKIVSGDSCCFYHGVFKGTLNSGVSVELEFADYFEFSKNRIIYRKTFFHAPSI